MRPPKIDDVNASPPPLGENRIKGKGREWKEKGRQGGKEGKGRREGISEVKKKRIQREGEGIGRGKFEKQNGMVGKEIK